MAKALNSRARLGLAVGAGAARSWPPATFKQPAHQTGAGWGLRELGTAEAEPHLARRAPSSWCSDDGAIQFQVSSFHLAAH